jgi:DNA-binding MarR family transcriptional regulator
MVSQYEILEYLKRQTKPVTVQDLVDHFRCGYSNVSKKIHKMNKFGMVQVEIREKKGNYIQLYITAE